VEWAYFQLCGIAVNARMHTTLVTEHSTDKIIKACREAMVHMDMLVGKVGWFDGIVVHRDVLNGMREKVRTADTERGWVPHWACYTGDMRLHGLPVIPYDTPEERISILLDLHEQGKRALMVEREPEIKLKED